LSKLGKVGEGKRKSLEQLACGRREAVDPNPFAPQNKKSFLLMVELSAWVLLQFVASVEVQYLNL